MSVASGTSRYSGTSRRQDPTRLPDGSLKTAKLMEVTLDTYVSFNAAQLTVDSHGELALEKHRVSSEDDATFILQVLYGVTRYHKFLDFLLNAFYYHNSGTAIRGDRPMYAIYAYLALFRLEELTFPHFKRLVGCQDAQKMIVFLRYLFNEANLRSYCRDEWIKLYDKEFVDGVIEGALGWMAGGLEALMVELERKVYLTAERKAEVFEVQLAGRRTVAAPFNLSEPRPKPLPMEEPPPPRPTGKPPPPQKEGPTKEEQAIEAAREQNRKAIEMKYSDPKDRIRLRTLERPSNKETVRAELEEREAAERAAFEERVKPKRAPKAPTAEVKLNTAAILREDAVYKKKQEQEAQAILKYEQELRDDSEFSAWQEKMLAMDEAEVAAEIERRRKEMAASAAAAVRARERTVEENLEAGRLQKAERARIEANRARELEALVEMNKAKRDAVAAERYRVRLAAQKVEQENKLKAERIRQEEAENARRRAEEEAAEQQRRMDIIRQLRALERVKREKVTEFDPTWTPGMGLMAEMSLSELKERLEMEKRHAEQEREVQRRAILASKAAREGKVAEKAEQLAKIRKVAAAQAASRKAAAKTDKVEKAAAMRAVHEEATLAVDDKLRAKRDAIAKEKARLAAEEKRVKFEQMQLAAGAAVVEEKKFEELRSGARREMRTGQARQLAAQRVAAETKGKAQTVRMTNVKAGKREKKDFLKAFDEKLAVLTEEERRRAGAELAKKQDLVTVRRGQEATLVATQRGNTWKPGDTGKTAYKTIDQRLKEQAEALTADMY